MDWLGLSLAQGTGPIATEAFTPFAEHILKPASRTCNVERADDRLIGRSEISPETALTASHGNRLTWHVFGSAGFEAKTAVSI